MIAARMKLRKPIDQILKGKVEPYTFEVGILQDGPHKAARSKAKGLKNYAGGPARKTGTRIDGTLSEISASARKQTGVNYLTAPFKKQNDDAVKLMRAFFDMVFNEGKATKKKRLENLIQAVVRNPIMRGTYGGNKKVTREIKGFSRKFIDTAQLFKGIKARVKFTGRGAK